MVCRTSCTIQVAVPPRDVCRNPVIKCPPTINPGTRQVTVAYNFELKRGTKARVRIIAKVGREILGTFSKVHEWQWWWMGDWAKVCDTFGRDCTATINFRRPVRAGERIQFEMVVEPA